VCYIFPLLYLAPAPAPPAPRQAPPPLRTRQWPTSPKIFNDGIPLSDVYEESGEVNIVVVRFGSTQTQEGGKLRWQIFSSFRKQA